METDRWEHTCKISSMRRLLLVGLRRCLTAGVVIALCSCSIVGGQAAPIEPGPLPPCESPHPIASLDPTGAAELPSIRQKFESIGSATAQTNQEANTTIREALLRGDAKTAQRAVESRLSGPTPTMDFLRTTAFPAAIRADAAALLRIMEDQRVADQQFVDAQTDPAIRDANRRRTFNIIVFQNAANQFRSDIGLAPLECPYY